VSILVLVGAVSYQFYPNFLSRLFMYLSIWWAGVELARCYVAAGQIRLRDIAFPVFLISTCALLQLYSVLFWSGTRALGAHPYLELRHLIFSIAVIVLAFLWRQLNWYGFYSLFGLFIRLAPISYGIYISHVLIYSLLWSFFGKQGGGIWLCGFLVTIGFAYLLELKFYPAVVAMFSKPTH
jgi:hypothetical protein